MVGLDLGGLAAEGQGTDHQRPLGDGVDLPVRPVQGSHQQGAAGQAGGIPDRGDLNIDGAAGAGEGGEGRGDDNRRHVVDLDLVTIDGNAEALHHVDQRLHGKLGFVAVPRAVETDHQAVADQLVFPHPFQGGDILDACPLADFGATEKQKQAETKATEMLFHRRVPRGFRRARLCRECASASPVSACR